MIVIGIIKVYHLNIDEGAESFYSKSLNISLRLVEPTVRRAEWMIFFKSDAV